tara:strand:- start:22 stop:204 length:183 start_codon:yes stop_codon:yes gene_type:complete
MGIWESHDQADLYCENCKSEQTHWLDDWYDDGANWGESKRCQKCEKMWTRWRIEEWKEEK